MNKGEWIRVLSGPLEHQGNAHFVITLFFLVPKLYRLEEKTSMFRLMALQLSSLILTGLVYVSLQFIINAWTDIHVYECVQGLSGPTFALKILTFFATDFGFTSFLFEVIELLMLLEQRTVIYHTSGLLAGLVLWYFTKPQSRFPNDGIRLGAGISRTRHTRGWGYANYTADEFRRIVDNPDDVYQNEEEYVTLSR